MSAAPTYNLPACPACSHRGLLDRPRWFAAHATSGARGVRHWIWVGCRHAQALRPTTPTADPVDVEAVEAAWRAALPKLLADRTATWTEAERAEFARVVEERIFSSDEPGHSVPATHEQPNNERAS